MLFISPIEIVKSFPWKIVGGETLRLRPLLKVLSIEQAFPPTIFPNSPKKAIISSLPNSLLFNALFANSIIVSSDISITNLPQCLPIIPIVTEIPEDIEIAKIMWADYPENIDSALPNLPKDLRDKFDCIRSEKWFFEFMNPLATKGNAAIELGKHLGIDASEILTAGDQNNDLSMIENI